jgi:microcystin degradation protein MlrC
VGDRADVLEALIDAEIEGVLVAGIASPGIINKLQGTNKTAVTVGGELGGGGPNVILNAEKIYFKNECAVLSMNGITTVLTEKRRPFHKLSDFTELGIELKEYRLLVVKSGYLSPELQSLSAPSFMILTDGAVCQHFANLENKHRQRPMFPFQNSTDFEINE